MRKSGGAGKKKQPDAIDEVEELLKLTQDNLLLKLTVNSHIKSKSRFDFASESSHSNAIDPDLDRRFQALRSKPNPNPKSETAVNNEDVDNLLARFKALKGRNTTSASNSVTEDIKIVDAEEADEEDEVQKIINWAKDAARLDPSPSSDIEDDDEDVESESESDDDSDEDQGTGKKKGAK